MWITVLYGAIKMWNIEMSLIEIGDFIVFQNKTFSGASYLFGCQGHFSRQKMLFRLEKVSWPLWSKPSGKPLYTKGGTRGCEQQSQSWLSTGDALLPGGYLLEENGQQKLFEGKFNMLSCEILTLDTILNWEMTSNSKTVSIAVLHNSW